MRTLGVGVRGYELIAEVEELRASGDFDAAREVNKVVVGRVRTGAESTERQSLGDLVRNLGAGLEPGGPRPESQEVPVYLKDLGLSVIRDYEDPPRGLVRFGDVESSSEAIVRTASPANDTTSKP